MNCGGDLECMIENEWMGLEKGCSRRHIKISNNGFRMEKVQSSC